VYDGAKKNNNGYAGRAPWFGCACCPPNLTRTIASVTGYFYAVRDESLYVNFYAQSDGTAKVAGTTVALAQTTDYPWQGQVRLAVTPKQPAKFALRLRIPAWAQGRPVPSDLYRYDEPTPPWTLQVNGSAVTPKLEAGYAVVAREWRAGDVVELNFPMTVHAVSGHPLVAATKDRVAFERGPLLYCVEDPERKTKPEELVVGAKTVVTAEVRPDFLGGVTVLKLGDTTAIPYYAWNNRGLATMAVWFRRAP
jgi:hypothetical protein